MPPTTLEDLFSSVNFLTIFIAFLLTIVNVMVGVSMLPSDNRKKRYLLHRILYGSVMICFVLFLFQNHLESANSFLDYTVFGIFLIVVPLSRRLNVTLHAIISSIALVLIGLVCFINLF